VIIRNGKAKPVTSREEMQSPPLLKILTLGNRQIEAGKVVPAADAVRRLRGKAAQ
jgi:hypothetical protein